MTKRSMFEDDPLEDFTRREITLGENTKRVYVSGTGPRDVSKGSREASTGTEAADTKLSSAFCFAPRSLAFARDRTSTALSSSVVTMASENGETFAGGYAMCAARREANAELNGSWTMARNEEPRAWESLMLFQVDPSWYERYWLQQPAPRKPGIFAFFRRILSQLRLTRRQDAQAEHSLSNEVARPSVAQTFF